ncbi:MAG: hypothetical protein KBG28_09605 [Kofleriaceae bacterium]|nr:hypothetical protein [Kofleriaceae bacterium]MBP6841394.1 hypothetical protein [Kofleriaceae bacterium]MBP9204207.1 hypothetical protein [Kofleriaceae bacterium]
MPRPLPVLASLLVIGAAAPTGAEPTRAQLEVGTEYDSNVYRLESGPGAEVAGPAAPMGRLGGRLSKVWSRAHTIAASASASMRSSLDRAVDREDAGIVTAEVRALRRLPERGLVVGAVASYYDVLALTVADNPRAFRTLGAGLQLSWPGPDGDGQGSVTLGLRDVAYKPDPDFAWTGPYLAVHLETTLWRSADDTRTLELAGDVRSEHRAYAGRALAWRCPADAPYQPRCTGPTELPRRDLQHAARIETTYTGERVLSAAYQLGYADSSSFGQSTLRHRLDLAATTELPGRIYATLTLTAQLDQYLDGLIIARDVAAQTFTTFEDDNRSALHARLSRALSRRWTVEGRLSGWATLAGDAGQYRRLLASVGLTWSTPE